MQPWKANAPHSAAKPYMAFFDSGPVNVKAAKVVLITNMIRQSIADRKGFSTTPTIPPSLLPGMPATNTARNTFPISAAFISSTCVMYVVDIVLSAAVWQLLTTSPIVESTAEHTSYYDSICKNMILITFGTHSLILYSLWGPPSMLALVERSISKTCGRPKSILGMLPFVRFELYQHKLFEPLDPYWTSIFVRPV